MYSTIGRGEKGLFEKRNGFRTSLFNEMRRKKASFLDPNSRAFSDLSDLEHAGLLKNKHAASNEQ